MALKEYLFSFKISILHHPHKIWIHCNTIPRDLYHEIIYVDFFLLKDIGILRNHRLCLVTIETWNWWIRKGLTHCKVLRRFIDTRGKKKFRINWNIVHLYPFCIKSTFTNDFSSFKLTERFQTMSLKIPSTNVSSASIKKYDLLNFSFGFEFK